MTDAPHLPYAAHTALRELALWLRESQYEFVTPSPATHARVLRRRAGERARDLRDVFGWSMPFVAELVPRWALEALHAADALEHGEGGALRSRVRFSSLCGDLFVHSAHPTTRAQSVFFGPDSYRFARLIREEVRRLRPIRSAGLHVVDVGCGSGVGGVVAARSLHVPPARLVFSDINPAALEMARVNAALAREICEVVESDVLYGVSGAIDLIVANPPYMMDPTHRRYRDGGGELGSALSLRILRECLERLEAGGTLILYTGVAIVGGVDAFRARATDWLEIQRASYRYFEIDPDVFGEELEQPGYEGVERIAAVALVAQKEIR